MRRAWLGVPVLLLALLLVGWASAATIGWGCHSANGATDSKGAFLFGNKTRTLNFSTGAYVQLVRQVGTLDAYNTAALVDDQVLDEGHIGYSFFGTGSASGAWWMAGRNVPINVGDVLYVRAYNVAKDQVATAGPSLEIGVNDVSKVFLGKTVTDVMNPQNYYFDTLRTEPIPEPASLLFLVPALAIWGLRRKK